MHPRHTVGRGGTLCVYGVAESDLKRSEKRRPDFCEEMNENLYGKARPLTWGASHPGEERLWQRHGTRESE